MKLIFVGIVKFCIGEEPEHRPYYPSRAGIFSLFRNSDRLAGTFHRKKTPLAENRFLQAGKEAENTKEKSRHCFTDLG
jgi:hypothetical protein